MLAKLAGRALLMAACVGMLTVYLLHAHRRAAERSAAPAEAAPARCPACHRPAPAPWCEADATGDTDRTDWAARWREAKAGRPMLLTLTLDCAEPDWGATLYFVDGPLAGGRTVHYQVSAAEFPMTENGRKRTAYTLNLTKFLTTRLDAEPRRGRFLVMGNGGPAITKSEIQYLDAGD